MEESLDLFKIVKDAYEIHDIDLKTYSPLTLAYIGDAVYDMVIRTKLVTVANTQVNKLHKRASKLVNAGAQATMITALLEDLTEEELQVYKRGRNAKTGHIAKNASTGDYHKATGLEAVFGYLYLTGDIDRIRQIYAFIKRGEAND
jgi:ribonuclease-3 family protein